MECPHCEGKGIYRNGIYRDTRTLSDLIGVYAPAHDSNDEGGYVRSIEADLLKWGIAPQEVTPMSTLSFGNVVYPAVVQSHLPASNPYVQESGAPDIPEAVFWHRMIGSLKGTDGWFHGGNAATCYGVGVEATDGPALAGIIYEWIAPRTGWYGESSGPAVKPYGDGAKFINEVGVLNVNRKSKAIEVSGNAGTPLDTKSRAAIVTMTAYWADQKKIPWNEFPILPNGRSFVIWHNEITGTEYKTCPGWVVMDETDALIEDVRDILKAAQGAGDVVAPPAPAPRPATITWDVGDSGVVDYHGTKVYALVAEVTCKRLTTPRIAASTKAKTTGPKIAPNEKVTVVGTLDSPWYIVQRPDGTFPRVSKTAFFPRLPRPQDAA